MAICREQIGLLILAYAVASGFGLSTVSFELHEKYVFEFGVKNHPFLF